MTGWIYTERSDAYKYPLPTLTVSKEEFINLPKDPSWQMKGLYGAIELIKIARNWNYKSGKWFFYSDSEELVQVIKKLHGIGKIGAWKYMWCPDMKRFNYLFYVNDFDNKKEVNALAKVLIKFFDPEVMYFKPCIYTRAGIYSGNKLQITPWIYKWQDRRPIKIDVL